MEGVFYQYLYEFFVSLSIGDVYMDRLNFQSVRDERTDTYVILELPNGIKDWESICDGNILVTLGARDRIIGLPNMLRLKEISEIFRASIPQITEDYSLMNVQYLESGYDKLGNHEWYYSIDFIINRTI